MGLDAEEEEIRILKERAQEKAELKTKLQAELLAEEGVEMQLQALALEREEEKDNAKKAAAGSSSTTTAAYYVTVPQGVFTGMQFKVDVNGKQYTVTCPQNASPGQKIKIELPTGVPTLNRTAASLSTSKPNIDTAPATGNNTNSMFYVTVPQGVYAGQPFQVKVNGQVMRVTCPQNAAPGQKIQIALPSTNPTSTSSSQTNSSSHTSSHTSSTNSRRQKSRSPKLSDPPSQSSGGATTQLFDVTVPAGVRPGQQFKIKAQGQEFLVTCPQNAGPGRKIRVPVQVNNNNNNSTSHGRQPYV